ncbi:ArsR family transcriptional regulator [Nocardia yamanashiensis]|uniref:arsenate reductase/protein-tyrosine-phosphatase family protein n=1 Tax=Nocardia yamanashiensis TaxID=209247 RepID=UPI001E619068|nr:ArsR family transcriptional regulator [Nocardia yamanashiensis]UGT38767.1 ArsR family transcriptional regulator [Nocardia yamanashiensis]
MASTRHELPPFVQLAAHPVRWRLLTALSSGDQRVRELVALVGEPQNLVSYHLRLLRDGGLVTTTRSSHDGRDSYYHLDLDRSAELLGGAGAALHPGLRMTPAATEFETAAPPVVLFVCTGNSARSVIAEALLRRHTGGRLEVFSAGTDPKPALHPDTVRVLRAEFDIDLAGRCPRHLDSLAGQRFDLVITLCDKARERCPEFGGDVRRIHWSIRDPAAPSAANTGGYPGFRATAAEIDSRIRYLLPTLNLLDSTNRRVR